MTTDHPFIEAKKFIKGSSLVKDHQKDLTLNGHI